MRLLIWSQYFWPESFPINRIASELVGHGLKVTVVTGKPNYPDGRLYPGYAAAGIRREDYCGIEIVRIPLFPRGAGSARELALNYLSFICSGYLFAPAALRGKTFDALFVYAPSPLLKALPAIFVAWLKRVPVVVWVQDLWPEALEATGFVRNRCLLTLIESAVRYVYRRSDSILIQSEAFRAPVERLVKNKEKIGFLPNFAPDGGDAMGRPNEHKSAVVKDIGRHFSVVFAGNIGTVQSCETIVSAAELLKGRHPIKFYLVGGGCRLASIEAEVKKRSLTNVVSTGRLSPHEMPSVFSAASVLLVTLSDSPAMARTVPSKLQTYLAQGKPVIASLNGEGARLVVEANAGIACPAGNPESLADAVLKMHAMSPNERLRLGENGHRYFRTHFESKARTGQLIEHLKKAVAKRKDKP